MTFSPFKCIIFGFVLLLMASSFWASSYPQTTPEILGVYLVNSSGSVIRYPKVGYTYNCIADIIPPDNQTITSVKMTFNGNAYVATKTADLQAWSAGASETLAASSVSCVVDASSSLGLITSSTATFEITTALPTCTDAATCTVSTTQSLISGTTYRYENITVSGTLQHQTVGDSSSIITLKADNKLTVSGIIALTAAAGTASPCSGSSTAELSLYGNYIVLSGNITSVAGAGYDGCSGYALGGNSKSIRFYATTMEMSGRVIQTAGKGGNTPSSGVGDAGDGGYIPQLEFNTNYLTFTGNITATGGAGGNMQDAAGSCTAIYSKVGGIGGFVEGVLLQTDGVYNFSSGTVTFTGGKGGDGTDTAGYKTSGRCGGAGGYVTGMHISTNVFINNAVWLFTGGEGGHRCAYVATDGSSRGGVGGNARDTYSTHHNLTKVTNTITNVAGLGGLDTPTTASACPSGTYGYSTRESSGSVASHTVTYAYADPSNNFANYVPGSTTSPTASNASGPSGNLTFTSPAASTPLAPLFFANVTWTLANSSYKAVIDWSTDNSTWHPAYYFPGPNAYGYISGSSTVPYEDVGINGLTQAYFSLNRLTTTVYLRGRQSYNSMFSPWVYHSLNVSLPRLLIINASRIPADSNPSTPTITFYCTVNDSYTNNHIQNAPIYINISGVNHSTTYDATTGAYKYTQSTPPAPGTTSWNCIAWKPNFLTNVSATGNFTYGDYYLSYPPGVTSVRLLCPFPTFYGITPWGQTAGRGVVRINNLNTTSKSNYTVSVNGTVANVSMFYKGAWTNVYNISIGNGDGTVLNTTASKFLSDFNSTTSDLWIYAHCLNATPYTTMNFTLYIGRIPS